MHKPKNTAPAKEPIAANKPNVDKSVSHFNWFARFETRQIQHKDLLKS